MLISKSRPVLLQVIYYMPAHPLILQEFTWGYEDKIPDLVRTHSFLRHWHSNIQAVISEVLISIDNESRASWRSVDHFLSLNETIWPKTTQIFKS